jgi:nitroreductase/dihydropteridine reductase
MQHKIIEDLNWRYATKKFDHSQKIKQEDLDTILEALRLVPTSYGLQPLKYLIIENDTLRSTLKAASWNQSQVTDASHLIVICCHIDTTNEDIDDNILLTSETRKIEFEKLAGYGEFVKKTISQLTLAEKTNWNEKQAYIALGVLLHTLAALRIDSTPMEGFDSEKYDTILNLTQQGLKSVLVCPIGYRSEEDNTQHLKKVRKNSLHITEFL